MKKGEHALTTIQPEYAFGSSESQQELAVVPANSTVYYEVELVSFVKEKESWEMNAPEKIEASGKKKEEGNVLFTAGNIERASKRYEKAVRYIEHDYFFNHEEQQQSKLLKVTYNLNNAACQLKLKDYKQAQELCTKVLELESRKYRRAQAYIQLVDLDLAEADIKKALEIDPGNRYLFNANCWTSDLTIVFTIVVIVVELNYVCFVDTRELKMGYRVLKEKMRVYNKKDAQFYGNIFAKMNLQQANAAKQEQRTPMIIDSKA
ncbi:hypothetical protein Golob_027721 [Gossypium lobatum]|uniref:peptidylprolyl isomerase n=1 Tax=Gossypium lobatum TaxID=34289 RepID=A0A7J8NI45_9ROSI|nr:hypothetical protein [Gossypium lobatum]